mgnify:CR=1 FL=1
MLTAKQEQFAKNIALEQMSYADAYRNAYDAKGMSDKTVHEKASRLKDQDKIRARIEELQAELTNSRIMSAQKRLEWLTEVVLNGYEKTENKLKAIDIMNKMQGEYKTILEGKVGVAKLEDIL